MRKVIIVILTLMGLKASLWAQSNVYPATGNVGIGTTSPQYKLHVNGDIYSEGYMRISGSNRLIFQDYGGGFYMQDNTWVRIHGNKSFYQNSGTMRTDGQFQVGPSGNRFIVNTSGNVGIGTSTPTSKLHVIGSGYFSNGITTNFISTGQINISDLYLTEDALGYGYNELGITTADESMMAVMIEPGHFKFGSTYGGQYQDGITILNGNIGINNDFPNYTLTVGGAVNASNYLINGQPFSGGSIDGITSLNGYIGINNLNPSSTLHIKPDGGNLNTGIRIDNPWYNHSAYLTAFEDGVGLIDQNEKAIATYENSEGGHSYHYAANNLYIDAQRNAHFQNNIYASGDLAVQGTIDASSYLINGEPFTGGSIEGITSLNGNIGVGNSNPLSKIHYTVHGYSEGLSGGIRLDNTWTDNKIYLTAWEDDIGLFSIDEEKIATYSKSTNVSTFTYGNSIIVRNGNAGIKRTPGNYALDVNGEVNASSYHMNSVVYTEDFVGDEQGLVDKSNNKFIAVKFVDGSYRFGSNGVGTSGLIVKNDNVLINKTTQTNTAYKLDVNGPIRVNEVVVNTTGADFVFEDDYKLRSLEEVETFITENNHLPEIPSAADMQANGMSVSELNTKLLQKVEELTLYLIEMKKENEELKTRIEKIENQ